MKPILKAMAIAGGVVLQFCSGANAAEIQRVGAPEKICQLTGETDWQSGKPTAAKTYSNFGLDAADLGYPVEHNGKLILLFGDSWPTLQAPGTLAEAPPNDAVGVVTARTAPSSAACLGMQIQDKPGLIMHINGQGSALKIYDPATVTGPEKIQQGFFDVPSGGVSVGGALYGFFWTDHCAKGHAIPPAPDQPLARPQGDARCPEDDALSSIGRGVMARSDDNGRTFHNAVAMPPGFVYAIAANQAVEQPDGRDSGIFIFGVPRYRASVPYMAEATVESFSDPHGWRFLAGRDAKGEPQWVNYQQWVGAFGTTSKWHPPARTAALFPDEAGKEACVGEFSVTWNKPLNQWLMFYNCHGIEARVAAQPWGPWSEPATILDPKDDFSCKIVMSVKGCGGRRDFWPNRRVGDGVVGGGFYAPFVLNRYTQAEKANQAVVYWLVSTWNPYEVDVMRSTLQREPH
jgi:hypothetical protein